MVPDLVKLDVAAGATNTTRPLTRSLDVTKERLAMDATRNRSECSNQHLVLPPSSDPGEEWRDLPSDKWVMVSSYGRVWRKARLVEFRNGRKPYWRPARLAKPSIEARSGYRCVGVGPRHQSVRVHRMVAEAFLGPAKDGEIVCHRDGNPGNNHVSNLYYGTQVENTLDAIRHGTNFHSAKTHCPQGHEYVESNIYWGKRGNGRMFRKCKTCANHREALKKRRGKARVRNASEEDQ